MTEPTIGNLFLETLASFPDRTFVHELNRSIDRRWTYREASLRLAAAVEQLESRVELSRGQRVVCYLEDMVPSAMFQLACAHLGATTIFLSPLFSVELLGRLARRLETRFVYTTAARAGSLDELDLTVLTYERLFGDEPSLGTERAEQILRSAAERTRGDDHYIMQPTSGSTGDPKLAVRTQRSMYRSAVHHGLGMSASDEAQRVLMVASLTHAFGQSILAAAVRLGAELSVPDALDVSCSLDLVRRLDPTYLLMPPRVLRALFAQCADREQPLFGPSARLFQFTGAPGDADLLAHLEASGVRVVEMYGSTETGQLAMTKPGTWKPGVVGPPLPDVVLRIADDGELLAKSPGSMIGYFGDDALTSAAFTSDGFYRTGDFAEITEDGMLRILGRKRDVFNVSDGSNIYPGRIETTIEALPWVKQVVLFGDQRPYLVALLVVQGIEEGAAPDGLLDPAEHADLHARARRDLAEVNAAIEPNERVRRFMLFARPMPSELYGQANLGKIRRDRRGLSSVYSSRIEELYSASVHPSRVLLEP